MDNTKLANLIVSKKLATVDQIRMLWPYLTPGKDIGMLCVENGIFPPVLYSKLIDFIGNSVTGTTPPSVSRSNTVPHPVPAPTKTGQSTTHPAIQTVPAKSNAEHPPAKNGVERQLTINHSIHEMLRFARTIEASDLHLSPGIPVTVRRYGNLEPVTGDALSQSILQERIVALLTDDQRTTFEKNGDMEFVYADADGGRYRVTLMKQRTGWDLTARCIPATIRSFQETGMPKSCHTLTQWAQGLVLVTGPACCGKSSTLTTLVEMINETRPDHIITLESPIEYIFASKRAQITQREIGKDSVNQEAALRAALREDPDIIVVGELRDLSTIQLAVSAAETGHLVFATMNTISASRTIYRLIDSFPPEEQTIMRNMISESLRGVISQQLIRRVDGSGMVAAFEVLLVNSAVANMIRKDEAHQLGTAMITGKSAGMQLLDDSLKALAADGIIAEEDVALRSINRSPTPVK